MKFCLLLSLQFSLCTISYAWTGLAVDLTGPTTKDQVECLRLNNYTAIFSRVYYGNTFDMDSLTTINNAAATGIGFEPLFIPDILSKVPAKTQVMNLYSALNDYNVKIQRLWVQVRDQNQWMATPFGLQQNIDFFNETIYTARNLTWKIGVFTTKQDWQTIMGNWAGQDFYQSAANLWYTNTTGNDTSGETTQDFSDFTNFGIWSTSGNTMPNVKQFGINENVCNLNVNRDFYYFPDNFPFYSVRIGESSEHLNMVNHARHFKARIVKPKA